MAVGIVLLVVVLAVVGGVIYFVKARAGAAADRAGTGANEILQSPPTSFPADRPVSPPALAAGADTATEREVSSASPGDVDTAPVGAAASPPVSDGAATSSESDPEDETDDEVAASRFRVPGARATGLAPPVTAAAPLKPTYPLEPVAEAAEPTEPTVVTEPTVPTEPTVVTEPAEAVAPAEPATPADVADAAVAAPEPESVIDLDALEPAGHDAAWREVVLQPEPDAVDHVLQALINRARFKQVGVEEVATELVERADLRGEEVSDVLAELVGRADDPALDPARSSELVLYNDEVPSRPGQLTDFAKLKPADKKRIIIRVLCLLVARSEDQQLPPRATADSGATSWPLARAVWPVAASDDEPEGVLPSRLAKSG
jgi:hypothetical protein